MSHTTRGSGLSASIRAEASRLGFEAVGFAPIRPSDHAEYYRAWLERGRHGEMGYLERPGAVAARLDPASRWPELRSAVVVAHHYSYSGSHSYSGGGEEEAAPVRPRVRARPPLRARLRLRSRRQPAPVSSRATRGGGIITGS